MHYTSKIKIRSWRMRRFVLLPGVTVKAIKNSTIVFQSLCWTLRFSVKFSQHINSLSKVKASLMLQLIWDIYWLISIRPTKLLHNCINFYYLIKNAPSRNHTMFIKRNNQAHQDTSDTKRGEKDDLLFLTALWVVHPNSAASTNFTPLGRKQAYRHSFFPPSVPSDCTAPIAVAGWSSYLLWIGPISLRLKNGGVKSSTFSDCCV